MTKEETLIQYLVEDQARSYRLAYSILHDREEALDAVQTAVCRALERQDSLRDPGAVKTWFGRIWPNPPTVPGPAGGRPAPGGGDGHPAAVL